MSGLRTFAETDYVDNVVIFISDSLRYDFLPENVRNLGITTKTISASTFTGSSIPSITSGMYPSEHKVWSLSKGQLAKQPPIFNGINSGYNAETIWVDVPSKQKPPLRINHIEQEREIESMVEPFVYVEHDKGGHEPYGYSFDQYGNSKDFFDDHANCPEKLSSLYKQSINKSEQRFSQLYDYLCEENMLDTTLLIFTSDHGELLGEQKYGGTFGHGAPLVPEAVTVPTVFIGCGLEAGKKLDGVISGVDLAPTVLSAQGRNVPERCSGRNLWSEEFDTERAVQSEMWQYFVWPKDRHQIDLYASKGVFTKNGGWVYNKPTSLKCYGLSILGPYMKSNQSKLLQKNFSVSSLMNLLKTYSPGFSNYGDPGISKTAFKKAYSIQYDIGADESEENYQIDKEHLKNLGYLE